MALGLGEARDNLATEERILSGRAERLAAWNRLLHGVPLPLRELDCGRLCGELSSADECAAYGALRACTALYDEAGRHLQSALRISVLYWFSNLGEELPTAREHLRPRCSSFHLAEAVGAHLSWEQAVEAMKRKPIDRAAYDWILEVLRHEHEHQWAVAFGERPCAPIDALSGPLSQNPYARDWRCTPRAAC
ncbi:MAG: hypothetical protein AB1778_03515 [Candidatus Bipolaricaulota bacterium]